jgi:hypothetical protein
VEDNQMKNNHEHLVVQHNLEPRKGKQPVHQNQIRNKPGMKKIQRGEERVKHREHGTLSKDV